MVPLRPQGSCCGLCSAQLNTKRRMKRVAKKDKGGGKAAVEEPNSIIPAQEQAKLAAKQDRTKEIQVHCPSHPPRMPAVWSEGKLRASEPF